MQVVPRPHGMPLVGSTFTKKAAHPCSCLGCGKPFLGKDWKSSKCEKCLARIKARCACGCGMFIEIPRWHKLHGRRRCIRGHGTAGRSYADIYGSRRPKCGFKSGAANLSKLPEVRAKISKSLRMRDEACMFSGKTTAEKVALRVASSKRLMAGKFKHRTGRYRSKLEADFAHCLRRSGVCFAHEPSVTTDARIFFPDFRVRRTYIEVSGFAYPAWQTHFVSKMRAMAKVCKSIHVLVPDKVYLTASKRLSPHVTRVWPLSRMQSLVNYLER